MSAVNEKHQAQHYEIAADYREADESYASGADKAANLSRYRTHGSVRLNDAVTGDTIRVPTPTRNPNDPLNWSTARKTYVTILACAAVFTCNFLAAGPTVIIVKVALQYGTAATIPDKITQIAYLFTGTALCQGIGIMLWNPLINKYGRRPIYIVSFSIYFVAAIWGALSESYGSEMASRLILGLAAGAGEALAPLTIADIWFLHERGTKMAAYNCFLSLGVAAGTFIDGMFSLSPHGTYKNMLFLGAGLIAFILILAIFTFPETSFRRLDNVALADQGQSVKKDTYTESLRLYSGTYTGESILKMLARPLGVVFLPPVMWAMLVFSGTIGFVVAVNSNFAVAYGAPPWNFVGYQIGLMNLGGAVGGLLGIFFGGRVSDIIAAWGTRRNGGVREPEMRLPAMMISAITCPLGVALYGIGIQHQMSYWTGVVAFGLISFSVVQGTNVALVYVIDSYKPIAGECITAILGFKACIGFLLSFYTNPWAVQSGYQNAFGEMAAISAILILGWIPFYIWGLRIRKYTWNMGIFQWVHWADDRETNE